MNAPDATMADIQRRAADDPEARHRAFDSYPWQKDRIFTSQLTDALGHATPGSSLSEIALQARIQRFEQQTRIKVDGDAYKAWLAQDSRPPPRIISEQTIAAEAVNIANSQDRKLAHLLVELGDPLGQIALQHQHEGPKPADPSVPSWQTAAPTAELYVRKDLSPGSPDKEPYPKKFDEIVEFLQSGKEISGIRKIPDTVIEDPSISTHGQLAAPLKPWERRAGGAATATATEGGPVPPSDAGR